MVSALILWLYIIGILRLFTSFLGGWGFRLVFFLFLLVVVGFVFLLLFCCCFVVLLCVFLCCVIYLYFKIVGTVFYRHIYGQHPPAYLTARSRVFFIIRGGGI